MLLLLGLLACDTSSTTTVYTCRISLESLEPTQALVGESVTLSASPLSELSDSALYMGGQAAEITALERSDCDTCDTCMEDAECDPCIDDCDACSEECSTCVETLSFQVPELAAGQYPIQFFNKYGASDRPLQLSVLAQSDTGDTGEDTGSQDTAPQDSGD
ncbi:MAG: hypothetical protein VX899_15320 [Myxococcota bacterium]|nr:hypothetical protein [Myxococcota bacterium]